MRKLLFAAIVAMAVGVGRADWIQTAVGTYDYTNTVNWADGVVDGVFPAALTLEGAQTITFSADTSLPDGLTIAYKGNFPMTFKSVDESVKTLTLKGGLSATMAGSADAKVTFAETLGIDLDGGERTITVSAPNAQLAIMSAISNGSLVIEGDKNLRLAGANTYGDGTTINGKTYVYVGSTTAFGTGTVTVNGDMSFCSDAAVTMTADNKFVFNCENFYGRANKNCALNLGEGDVIAPNVVKHWAEGEGGIVLGGSIKAVDSDDAPCKPTQIEKWGSKTLTLYSDWKADGDTFTIANGPLNFYGSISGVDPKIAGTSNSTPFNMYGANTFAGTLEVSGGNVTVYTRNDAAIPDGAKVKIMNPAVLAAVSPSAAVLLSSGKVDENSTGVLALGQNETADFDMSRFAGLRLGANGSDRTITGVVKPNSDGVYRLGGGGRTLTLDSVNALSGEGRLEIRDNNVILTKANALTGGVVIYSGQLELRGDTGMLTQSDVDVFGGKFFINSNGSIGTKRAETLTLRPGASFEYVGNDKNSVSDSFGKLVFDVRDPALGVLGGVCHLKLTAKAKTATLTVGELERRNDMIFRIQGVADGNKLMVGGPNENTVVFKVGNADEITGALVGGGGEAGTTTVSVYPYAFIDNGTYNDSLTTYDENGFRGLDIDTEYVTSVTPGTISQENVRIPVGTTMTISENTTVNSVFLQGSDPDNGATIIDGNGVLTLSSGVVVLGYHRNNKPYVKCPVDFGNHQGVVCYPRGKGSSWSGAIHGTNGAIFFQTSDSVAKDDGGTGLTIDGVSAGSMLTGDVVYHGRLVVNTPGVMPGGEGRPGNIRAYGYASLKGTAQQVYDGVYGTGEMFRDGEMLMIGGNNANGDLEGNFGGLNKSSKPQSTILNKIGTGRQRVAGKCEYTGATTVEAGVLQNDGSFVNSAVTVKTGATLAGSGSFAKLVTLEAGAVLEAGSTKTEDQVMDLDGGLTLQGDAELNLVLKDRDTVGNVEVAGALTVPEGKIITVNVVSEAGERLRGGTQYTVLEADEQLQLASFKRGSNCGTLSLSEDGKTLLMSGVDGLTVIFR